jgi:tyrosyl-tRNA synthetase
MVREEISCFYCIVSKESVKTSLLGLLFQIGSATALIGDPSDKHADRVSLGLNEIASNSSNIHANVAKIFENHERFIWKRNNSKELPKLK